MNKKTSQRIHRHRKIRMKIAGDSARPRLVVFRSNRFVSAQLIDDKKGSTIASATDMGKAGKELGVKVAKDEQRKIAYARAVGTKIAELAKAKKITKVVFDRAGFIYTGRVKALAEAAREGGLEF